MSERGPGQKSEKSMGEPEVQNVIDSLREEGHEFNITEDPSEYIVEIGDRKVHFTKSMKPSHIAVLIRQRVIRG